VSSPTSKLIRIFIPVGEDTNRGWQPGMAIGDSARGINWTLILSSVSFSIYPLFLFSQRFTIIMDTRRDFIKKAGLITGGTGLLQILPASIAKALAINPAAGTTFMDAEHIVFLMQENRSFDHAYGTLQGVRGFNDPRAIRLPNNKSRLAAIQ
jgi:hypothetical protein